MKQSDKNLPLILTAVVCAVSLVVMVLALCVQRQTQPEFIPPPFEENAVTGIPEVPDDLGWTPLDTPNFCATVCGNLVPKGNLADIWLYNNQENTVWLKLRILDENGHILGETGLLKPGEYVRSVMLTYVPESGAKITLKLMSYTPHTYHSEGVVSLNTLVSE